MGINPKDSLFSFYAIAASALLSTSISFSPASLGQSMQEKFGYPDASIANFQAGVLSIPCITHVKDGSLNAYYEAVLVARGGQFPITFEVANLTPSTSCAGMTYLRADTVTGVVSTNTSPFPYVYHLKYKGVDQSGKMTLALESSGLYKVLNATPAIVGVPGQTLEIVPSNFDFFNSYELIDVSTNAVLNTSWGLRSLPSSLTFKPNVAAAGKVMLVDHGNRTLQFVTYDVRGSTSPSLSLFKKSTFSIFGDFAAETIPSICQPSSCIRSVNATIAGSQSYQHSTYKLRAQGRDYVIRSISARDLNGVTTAAISGITAGTVIRAGTEVQFTLDSGLTRGLEAMLQWSVEVEELNTILVDTVRFRSN